MQRKTATITLAEMFRLIHDGEDGLEECLMQSLGLTDTAAGLDEWCGTNAERWGLTEADWNRRVIVEFDSGNRLDHDSNPQWA